MTTTKRTTKKAAEERPVVDTTPEHEKPQAPSDTCTACNGTGLESNEKLCEVCNGTGTV